MKKEYESTIEEAVHAHFRLAELVGTIAKHIWMNLVFVPLTIFALCGLLLTFFWLLNLYLFAYVNKV